MNFESSHLQLIHYLHKLNKVFKFFAKLKYSKDYCVPLWNSCIKSEGFKKHDFFNIEYDFNLYIKLKIIILVRFFKQLLNLLNIFIIFNN